MQFLQDTHVDFMKYRKFWITVSLVLVVLALYGLIGHGHRLNLGIDFAGGTQMNLRFREHPEIDKLRKLLEGAGLGDAQILSFGEQNSKEVLIKARVRGAGEGDNRERILGALSREYNRDQATRPDVNQMGVDALTALLLQKDPDKVVGAAPAEAATLEAQASEGARAHYEKVAQAILAERRKVGILESWPPLATAPGVSPAVVATLQQDAYLGSFTVLAVENVGPQIGKELRTQGFWAVVLSLLGMLTYIAFRFELRFGVGAVMASLHDVVVTLGLFTLMGYEFNLTTVAAFLTLVGYSVNDTVVIFDRIREDMRKNRRKPMIEVMNEAINQTLSRTIMTSGLTMLTVAALLFLGGDVLRGFAFVMTIGIIVGTYSSIYVASPFALLWEQLFGASARQKKALAMRGGATGPGGPSTPASRREAPPRAAAPKAEDEEPSTPARPVAPRPAQRPRSRPKSAGRR